MGFIQWFDRPTLTRPTLVSAFTGWNDAGDAASTALRHLIAVSGADKVAALDPDEFYEFQSSRPQARLVDGDNRIVVWPSVEIWSAPSPSGDLLLMLGVEPQLRWPTFCRELVQMAADFDIGLSITFGALLADVLHDRPVNVIGSSPDSDLLTAHDLVRSRYEGPTGIVGVLNHSYFQHDVDTISLWAAVPSYVSTTPSPKAALALLERFATISPRPLLLDRLRAASVEYEQQVTDSVAEDPDATAYVTRLALNLDVPDDPEIKPDPAVLVDDPSSARELVDEVERFLRDQHD